MPNALSDISRMAFARQQRRSPNLQMYGHSPEELQSKCSLAWQGAHVTPAFAPTPLADHESKVIVDHFTFFRVAQDKGVDGHFGIPLLGRRFRVPLVAVPDSGVGMVVEDHQASRPQKRPTQDRVFQHVGGPMRAVDIGRINTRSATRRDARELTGGLFCSIVLGTPSPENSGDTI